MNENSTLQKWLDDFDVMVGPAYVSGLRSLQMSKREWAELLWSTKREPPPSVLQIIRHWFRMRHLPQWERWPGPDAPDWACTRCGGHPW